MISAVIITKNEAHIIGKTLESIQNIVDEIIIVDSGSTDATISICKKFNAIVINSTWDGYGANKNKGIKAANNNWILNIDADEVIGPDLHDSIKCISGENEKNVYSFNFITHYRNKPIKYGVCLHDRHIRLFNRNHVYWNDMEVHEELIVPKDAIPVLLKGKLNHYSFNSYDEYVNKSIYYARLSAEKYFLKKKKASFFKLYLSPVFSFLKNYFFRLGFLDGWEGFLICKTYSWYTFSKYVYLKEMYNK